MISDAKVRILVKKDELTLEGTRPRNVNEYAK